MNLDHRDKILSGLKVAGTIIAGVYLLSTIDMNTLLNAVQDLPLLIVFVASLLVIVKWLTTTLTLQILLKTITSAPFRLVLRVDALDYVANSFIPSKAGSLISGPVLLDRHTSISKQQGLTIKSIQFTILSAVTGITAVIVLLPLFHQLSIATWTAIAISSIIYLGFAGTVVFWIAAGEIDLLERILPDIITEGSLAAVDKWKILRAVGTATGLTVFAHLVLVGARFGALSVGIGANVPLAFWIIVPVVGYTVSVLPISLGGAGVVEVVGIAVLTASGVPPSVSAALVVVDRTLSVYIPLIVLAIYVNVTVVRGAITGGT